MAEKQSAWIRNIETLDTGGSVALDVVSLNDGKVVVIGWDSIATYRDMASFVSGDRPLNWLDR